MLDHVTYSPVVLVNTVVVDAVVSMLPHKSKSSSEPSSQSFSPSHFHRSVIHVGVSRQANWSGSHDTNVADGTNNKRRCRSLMNLFKQAFR